MMSTRLLAACVYGTLILVGCARAKLSDSKDSPMHYDSSAEFKSKMPGSVDRESALSAIASHDRAVYIKQGWIRDPHITLGPDGLFYLTGTTPNPGDPREIAEPYNTGLDAQERQLRNRPSVVGYSMQVWRSANLVDWENLGTPFSLTDGYWAKKFPDKFAGDRSDWRLWAPELHFINGKWAIVHTSPAPQRTGSNLALTASDELRGPFTFPLGDKAGNRHDPSLFQDEDGKVYLLWGNTTIVELTPDLGDFVGEPVRIDPSNRTIGHEGATLAKIGGKYIHFGTGWSTDKMRQGTYNLYYCEADSIFGPYGERKFAGRFLGHGTPFQDKQGRWWCTAFYNANVPPISREDALKPSVGDTANTINEQGTTIVPLDVRVNPDGSVYIRAKDPAYATPGPEEAQAFE